MTATLNLMGRSVRPNSSAFWQEHGNALGARRPKPSMMPADREGAIPNGS